MNNSFTISQIIGLSASELHLKAESIPKELLLESLYKEIITFIKRNKACKEGYSEALHVENWGLGLALIRKYWSEVTGMHLHGMVSIFDKYYKPLEKEFELRSIYYNRSADNGIVLLYNATDVEIGGCASVKAFGNSRFVLKGNANAYATDNCFITLYNKSILTLDKQAECVIYGRNHVKAYGNSIVTSQGPGTVTACENSTVVAVEWNKIKAVGTVKVTAPNTRCIDVQKECFCLVKPSNTNNHE